MRCGCVCAVVCSECESICYCSGLTKTRGWRWVGWAGGGVESGSSDLHFPATFRAHRARCSGRWCLGMYLLQMGHTATCSKEPRYTRVVRGPCRWTRDLAPQ
jgi:hypothetical protein